MPRLCRITWKTAETSSNCLNRLTRHPVWFNPDTLADESIAWLEDGAPKDERLLLTSDTPKKSRP